MTQVSNRGVYSKGAVNVVAYRSGLGARSFGLF